MPRYEMTPAEVAEYGDRLNIWQAIRLLQTWSPLLEYGQRFLNTADPYEKGIVVTEACEWLASKTDATVDDELVRRLAAVLRTDEGEDLVRFGLSLAGIK